MLTIDEGAIILGSVLVLMVWTYLWKPQPIYHYATAVLIGAAWGHFFLSAITALWDTAFKRVATGAATELWIIIPIILGFMLFARFRRGYAWLSTISIYVLAGTSIALLVAGGIRTDIFNQLRFLMGLQFAGVDAYTVISNLVIFLGSFTVIVFFIFSRRVADSSIARGISRVGRVLLLGMAGVSFATGYAFRITMALNALQPFNATYPGQVGFIILAVMVIILLIWERSKK